MRLQWLGFAVDLQLSKLYIMIIDYIFHKTNSSKSHPHFLPALRIRPDIPPNCAPLLQDFYGANNHIFKKLLPVEEGIHVFKRLGNYSSIRFF